MVVYTVLTDHNSRCVQ